MAIKKEEIPKVATADIPGDLSFVAGTAHEILVNTPTTPDTAGANLTIGSGDGSGAGSYSNLMLNAGTSGNGLSAGEIGIGTDKPARQVYVSAYEYFMFYDTAKPGATQYDGAQAWFYCGAGAIPNPGEGYPGGSGGNFEVYAGNSHTSPGDVILSPGTGQDGADPGRLTIDGPINGEMRFYKEEAAQIYVLPSTSTDTVGASLTIRAADGAADDANGGALYLRGGARAGTGKHGALRLGDQTTGDITIGETTNEDSTVTITAGDGSASQVGADVVINAGYAVGPGDLDGGSVHLYVGDPAGAGTQGKIQAHGKLNMNANDLEGLNWLWADTSLQLQVKPATPGNGGGTIEIYAGDGGDDGGTPVSGGNLSLGGGYGKQGGQDGIVTIYGTTHHEVNVANDAVLSFADGSGIVKTYNPIGTTGALMRLNGTTAMEISINAGDFQKILLSGTDVSFVQQVDRTIKIDQAPDGNNGASLTIKAADGGALAGGNGGTLTILAGGGKSGNGSSGNLTLDTGGSSGIGFPGTLSVGRSTASILQMGRIGNTRTTIDSAQTWLGYNSGFGEGVVVFWSIVSGDIPFQSYAGMKTPNGGARGQGIMTLQNYDSASAHLITCSKNSAAFTITGAGGRTDQNSNSGNVTLTTGAANGTGTPGTMTVTTAAGTGSGTASGNGAFSTGIGGTSPGTSDGGDSGNLSFATGTGGQGAGAFNPGDSGTITISTGNAGSSGTGNANSGNITIDSGTKSGSGTTGEINVGTTNASAVNLGNSGGKIGLFGTAAASRPAAYTQTYATASRTHSDFTSATLTDQSGGSADTTIALITNANNAGSADVGPTADAIADLAAQVNALRVDLENAKQVINQLLDDLQTLGALQ